MAKINNENDYAVVRVLNILEAIERIILNSLVEFRDYDNHEIDSKLIFKFCNVFLLFIILFLLLQAL